MLTLWYLFLKKERGAGSAVLCYTRLFYCAELRSLFENVLSESRFSLIFPKSLEMLEGENACDISHMAVLIFWNSSIINRMVFLGEAPGNYIFM